MHLPSRPLFDFACLRRCAALALTVSLGACASGIALDEPIEGPRWRLERLADAGFSGSTSPISPSDNSAAPGRESFLQFDTQGRMSGSGPCNALSGRFTRSGSQLKLSQLGATRMACANPASDQREKQLFQALQSTASYRLLEGQQLLLLDNTGRTLAALRGAAAR